MKNFSSKMKGNYPLKSNRRELYILVTVFVCLIFLITYGKAIFVPVTQYLVSPIYAVKEYVQTSKAALPSFIRSRIELEKRIQQLEQELEIQKGSHTAFEYIEKENKTLRNLLGATTTRSGILAGVITQPPRSPYDMFVIDQGSDDGVVEGAAVFYGKGAALGYVARTLPRQSIVTLFSSPHVETTVYIFGPNIFTTAYGEGGGVIRLSVPQGLEVSEGDMVVLPSLEMGILGKVHSVISNPAEPEQRAYVAFEYPLQSIRYVRVAPVTTTPRIDDALFENMNSFMHLFTAPVPLNTPTHFGSTSATTTTVEVGTTTETTT